MKCNINGRKNIISPIIPPIIKPTVLFLTPGNPKLKTSIPPTKIAITGAISFGMLRFLVYAKYKQWILADVKRVMNFLSIFFEIF